MRATLHSTIVLTATILLFAGGCGDSESSGPAAPVNYPPTIDVVPDTTIAYGDTLRVNVTGSDPDGGPLTFSMAVMVSLSEIRTGYSTSAGIDKDSGSFWFYPGPRDVPDRSFQFAVTDDGGLDDTAILTVTTVVRELSTLPD
ncbi:MAG: hypothetical protein L0Z51_07075 [Candidatus Latescibacteria bacterium]|nr:hypothetical protein [Candidatus Latescibacterota bacterium]